MPPNHVLRKCAGGYKLSKSQEKINHLKYMDDIKLCEKWKRIGNPKMRIYSQNVGMEFSIEKCTMLIIKSEKWHMTEEWNYEI